MGYAAASVGLFILILAFFYTNSPDTLFKQNLTAKPKVNFCELVDPVNAPTFQAPPDNITKTGSEDDPSLGTVVKSSEGCGDTDNRHQFPESLTTYQLVRKNVPLSTTEVKSKKEKFTGESCHFDSAQEINIEIPEVDKSEYKVFFPEISGEISLGREIPSRTRGENSDLMYFIDYGLVFLLHLNTDGTFIQYEGSTTEGKPETFYLADVYKDIGSGRPELPPDAFECSAKSSSLTPQQVIIPTQDTATAQGQMKLEYFVLTGTGDVYNGWGIHCKPAIYLYPPKKQLVNVKVSPSGFLTYVDPPYNQNSGWTIWAGPDGKLQTINDSRFTIYEYLYFESKVPDQVINKPAKGWVVKFEDLENFYQDILPKLGLNEIQTRDFINYWEKALPYSPYYFVGIIDQDNVNEIERLEITPKPDSINRVRVYFERLDSFKTVKPPNLSSFGSWDLDLGTSTFKVVEWGGMVKTDPSHPFTCSQ